MVHPDRVLVKTSIDNSHWQTDKSPSLYTSKVTPWCKDAAADGFLGNYASIRGVDLIKLNKLDCWDFMKQKPYLNSLPFY